MLAKRLHTALFPATAPTPTQLRRGLWVSLAIALAFCIPVLAEAFEHPYVVQDDARQHVFWMWRFIDPALFPNDLIADYFQSVAPKGYTTFYWVFIRLGLDPLLLSKLVPPILAVGCTALVYGLCLEFLRLPVAGAIAALLANQVMWAHDDLASASPRAFLLPLFLGFLYGLVQQRIWVCAGLMALLGLFYPQYVFVGAGVLVLQVVRWQDGRVVWAPRKTWLLSISGLIVAFFVLLPFALSTSVYGPVITVEQARQLPDFYPGGRSVFFNNDAFEFWVMGMRSGLFPTFKPVFLAFGFALPWLLRSLRRFPLTTRLHHLGQLWRLPLVALTLFFAAHALLFRLHLPSRYSGYTLRVTLLLAATLSLTLLLEAALRRLSQHPRALGVWGGLAIATLLLLFYPLYDPPYPKTNYTESRIPQIAEYLKQQPKDIRIGSLLRDADTLPTFSHRSVWATREYAIPYHLGYAQPYRARVLQLILAHYTVNPAILETILQNTSIDYWLIDADTFNRVELADSWVRQYPDALNAALDSLAQGSPLLETLAPRCQVLTENERVLIDSACLLEALAPQTER